MYVMMNGTIWDFPYAIFIISLLNSHVVVVKLSYVGNKMFINFLLINIRN